ncbi:amidohydrolase [Brevibacterium antiquum]|uniref:amidohydrolase n=1 Tax=Brevibacterium antiquum TaxID=234835 RepID=UPI0018E0353D|nr:amidohydrolase family protein [Brevibacterium antiquum]
MAAPDTAAQTGESYFVNGKIFTGESEKHFVSGFGVCEGRFSRVLEDSEINSIPSDAEVVDLQGRTVVPGMLDIHTHPAFMASLTDSLEIFPPRVTSLDKMLDVLRSHPSLGAGSEAWVMAHGFDESKFSDGRKPSAQDLDRVAANQPVVARRCDGHTMVVNSFALELAEITAATPDPEGGRIERDDNGAPTGVLVETSAMNLVEKQRPSNGDRSAEQLAGLDEHFLSHGLVGVNDLYASFIDDPLPTFRRAGEQGFSPQAVIYPGWDALVDSAEAGIVPDLSDDDRAGRIKIGGVKLFMDGAFSDRNAWNEDPYPGTCSHGGRVATDDDMRSAVAWARRNGVQVAFHAMGDRALNQVLTLFGEDEPWMGDVPSIRLDHASLFTPEMIDNLLRARMSFGVISHTIFFFAEYEAYANNLSDTQFDNAYPIRSFYERVPHTALASDSPATAWADADNVFTSIRAAVERRSHDGSDIGQNQAISVAQAMLLYTARAAEVTCLEGLGRIRPGFEASFVVLDRDLFTLPIEQLDAVQVSQTWLAGTKRYEA